MANVDALPLIADDQYSALVGAIAIYWPAQLGETMTVEPLKISQDGIDLMKDRMVSCRLLMPCQNGPRRGGPP